MSILKKKACSAFMGILIAASTILPVNANAATASVTWKTVEQGINNNDQYVYDGNKLDYSMSNAILYKKSADKWGYIKNGVVDKNSGVLVVPNWSGWWLIRDGWLDMSTSTGLMNMDSTGSNYLQFKNGLWQLSQNETLASNEVGWFFVRNGKVDFTYTGLAANENGIFYVQGGAVNFNYTGIVPDNIGFTTSSTPASGFVYIKDGKFDQDADTVAYYAATDTWWKVRNGLVDFTYNGLASNENGWFYINGGKFDTSYTGPAQNELEIWYIKNGVVDFDFTGFANDVYFQNGRSV